MTASTDRNAHDPRTERRRFEAEFRGAMKRLMIHMVLADGRVDELELQAVSDIYAQISGRVLALETIGAEAMLLSASGADPLSTLAELAPRLNDAGREVVVQAGLMVAAADGRVSPEEAELLVGIARSLDITEAHFRGIVSSLAT